jgi:hypothetical protein
MVSCLMWGQEVDQSQQQRRLRMGNFKKCIRSARLCCSLEDGSAEEVALCGGSGRTGPGLPLQQQKVCRPFIIILIDKDSNSCRKNWNRVV